MNNFQTRFGYKKCSDFGIRQPSDAPDECCMAIELLDNALEGVNGMVEYPKEFFE